MRNVSSLQPYAASKLRIKYCSEVDKYLIDQLLFASWIPHSANTRRIWLGMWSIPLLTQILPPNIASTDTMQTPDRYKYCKIIRKLTFPLTYAYRQMLKLHRTNHSNPDRPALAIPCRTRYHTSLLLPQQLEPGPTLSLHHQQSYTNPTTFTFSDAANSINETTLGIHRTNT